MSFVFCACHGFAKHTRLLDGVWNMSAMSGPLFGSPRCFFDHRVHTPERSGPDVSSSRAVIGTGQSDPSPRMGTKMFIGGDRSSHASTEACIGRLVRQAAQLIRWNAMMIGPSTITRLIQITGRTEVAQTVSEIDFIARQQPDNPNAPVQPRQQRTDQNTSQGKTTEHRPRAEQDTIVGRQAFA